MIEQYQCRIFLSLSLMLGDLQMSNRKSKPAAENSEIHFATQMTATQTIIIDFELDAVLFAGIKRFHRKDGATERGK